MCFWLVFKKRCIWHPKLSHIIRLSKVLKPNKIWIFLTKSDNWRDHGLWLVTKSCSPKLREELGGMARAAVTLFLPLRAVVICTSPLIIRAICGFIWKNDNNNISPLYCFREARMGICISYHQMGLVSQNIKKSKNYSWLPLGSEGQSDFIVMLSLRFLPSLTFTGKS